MKKQSKVSQSAQPAIASKRKLARPSVMLLNQDCPCCGQPASDIHELWIPKSSVQAAGAEKRIAINAGYNMIAVCNACNIAMTHPKQVILRRQMITQVGQRALGGYTEISGDDEIREAGINTIQGWINELGMVGTYRVRSMSEL